MSTAARTVKAEAMDRGEGRIRNEGDVEARERLDVEVDSSMHFDCLNNHPVEQRRELVLGHNFLIPFFGGFFWKI
jgi:hypothetical protein